MIKNQRNILQKRKKKIQEKLNEKNIEPTGFPGHDESFLTINGEKYAFLAMIDSNNQSIINDQIMPENKYRDFFRNIHNLLTKRLITIQRPKHSQSTTSFIINRFKKGYINWRWIKRISNNYTEIQH